VISDSVPFFPSFPARAVLPDFSLPIIDMFAIMELRIIICFNLYETGVFYIVLMVCGDVSL
jgi:hypothetical protein